ncbi:aminotransferase class V-fold PLP-dependent enzyme [Kiloniella sp. EL199]|uniref:pyridoxal phosphate-dependent decarboxylase family protein n=1 Tax=Kiloniella sp. EL199 TaxID=2107581 RepID=UPI000EA15629|nr:aminotransferase class V-fold PLP-dependent enzyme [Kiloniella sp. EL199]
MSNELLRDAYVRSERYLSEIDTQRVFPANPDLMALRGFEEPFPEKGHDPNDILRHLDEVGSPATVASTGSRYFGFVVGGSLPVSVGANWMATAWDQVASSSVTSPATDKIEKVAAQWLLDVLDLPRQSAVGFVTGATMATFTALAAARHKILKKQGWNVEDDGLFGAPEIKVIVSDEVHVTVLKALSLLGFGKSRVIKIPTDTNGAMDIRELPVLDSQTIVCTQAGNVNSGAFDPINEICDLAQSADAWVHVDGAFGLWARSSSSRAYLTRGIDKADSWATDGHKWLNTPYDGGVVVCRDGGTLHGAMSVSAAYLKERDGESQNYIPEFSKRARGVDIWAALKFLGREGVNDLISGCCNLAQYFANGLEALGLNILNDVVLNQIVVSWDSAEKTEALIQAVQQDGTCWFGPTVWKGHNAFRLSVSSWKITSQDIDLSLKAIENCMKKIETPK